MNEYQILIKEDQAKSQAKWRSDFEVCIRESLTLTIEELEEKHGNMIYLVPKPEEKHGNMIYLVPKPEVITFDIEVK